ncbi:MAG: 50S ribosomal protein L9 [Candidatus Margulisiibacteriota bacterium]
MKVILNKEVENVGDKFDTVEVKEGYARNYLFPRKLAETATPQALKELEKRVKRDNAKEAARTDEYKNLAGQIESSHVEIKADCGEGGKLFGSITSMDISQALKNLCSIEIDKKKIVLSEPIRTAGEHSATVKIFKQIEAKLKVTVTPS